MALPKKNKKNINIVTKPLQGEYPTGYNGIAVPNRRKELGDFYKDDRFSAATSMADILHLNIENRLNIRL